ncbi:MAG: protease inhibitor I42 family protein [Verrucomicrobia bacterium]|nr:protease inhibitor I42 family protein [Verrucomicrobiota bacterium]
MFNTKIVLCLGIVVASVSALRAAEPGGHAPVKILTQKDNGAAVTVALKSRLMIRLPTQAGTGFSWTPKAASSLLRLVRSYEEAPPHMLPGATETKVFIFMPVASGTDQLELYYRRPWEHGVQPAKVFRFTATVE